MDVKVCAGSTISFNWAPVRVDATMAGCAIWERVRAGPATGIRSAADTCTAAHASHRQRWL